MAGVNAVYAYWRLNRVIWNALVHSDFRYVTWVFFWAAFECWIWST